VQGLAPVPSTRRGMNQADVFAVVDTFGECTPSHFFGRIREIVKPYLLGFVVSRQVVIVSDRRSWWNEWSMKECLPEASDSVAFLRL